MKLRDGEPGERHLITDDLGKFTGALAKPSTYPEWMGKSKRMRTREQTA
jgi:hypothetical protein